MLLVGLFSALVFPAWLLVVPVFFSASVRFWKLTDVDNKLHVLHKTEFLIALGSVSLPSEKGKGQ